MMKYKDFKNIYKTEYNWYLHYLYNDYSIVHAIWSLLRRDKIMQIAKWQETSRKCDYWKMKRHNLLGGFIYFYFLRKKNILGMALNIEVSTNNIGKGLKILHSNIVINGNAIIGENLRLLGTNVIGNGGPGNLCCPIIGNNVTMGAGSIVVGPITIADGITIAAGAVVVSSFTEKGITIGGVPAKKIK